MSNNISQKELFEHQINVAVGEAHAKFDVERQELYDHIQLKDSKVVKLEMQYDEIKDVYR